MKKLLFTLATLLLISVNLNAQNYALSFDGSNDYAKVSADASLNMGGSSFTVEFWVKSSQNHSSEVIFVEYGIWEEGNYQVVSDNPTHLKVNFYGRSSADGAEAALSNEWADSTWHHVAGVFNNSGDYLKVYLDGIEVASVTETNSPDNVTLPLYMASRGGTGKFSQHQMDKVRIWNVARTQSEIQDNMNKELTGSESNLVAHYEMNAGSGGSLTDNTTNNNDGTLYNMDDSDWVAGYEAYSGGSGTSGDPFQIATTGDLIDLSNFSGDWDDYFIQTADISFNSDETLVDWDGDGSADGSGTSGFSPIGNFSTKFTGSYDGDGHTIDNLFIDRSSTNYIGLFGYTSNATIENLGVTNVEIYGSSYVGGLVGASTTSIRSCFNSGKIFGSVYTGGLVGANWGTIRNSYSKADIQRNSGTSEYLGGFCGYVSSNSTIEYCYSTGKVIYDGATNPDDKGFLGNDNGTYANNFFDSDVSNQTSATGATAKTTEEMTNATTTDNIYLDAGWDFKGESTNGTEDIWNIGNSRNDGYPYFDWQYSTDDASLPVTLASFTGEVTKSGVELNWITESEVNNQGFLIERSVNSKNAYSEIASFKTSPELKGAGSTSERTNYHFTDTRVEQGNTYWYRLVDVAYNGKNETHNDLAISVKVDGQMDSPYSYTLKPAYPNPFNAQTQISYSIPEQQQVTIALYDVRGEKLRTLYDAKQAAGNHSLNIGMPDLPSGIYFVQMSTPNFHQAQEIVLLK